MRRADRRAGGPVPPHRAEENVTGLTRQLIAAGAVDGMTRPLDHYIRQLLKLWLAQGRLDPAPPAPPPPASPPAAHPEALRESRESPLPADALPADAPDPHVGLRILTALAFLADGANFSVALAVVGNAAPTTTLIVVAGLAGIALSLAHALGSALRDRVEGWRRTPLPLLVAMGTLVVGIGGIAASIRLAVPTSPAGASAFGEPDPAADAQAELVNLLLTLLLLILFLASTLMAGYVAFATRRSPGARCRRVRFGERWARGWHSVRRRRESGRIERERKQIHERETLLAQHEALAELLRCRVDLLIANAQQDPAATDTLTTRPTRQERR